MAMKWVMSFTHLISQTADDDHHHTPSKPNQHHTSSTAQDDDQLLRSDKNSCFQMPLHYPRYSKADYEVMEEWRLDMLLAQYGLHRFKATPLEEKRSFAMGTFLWPDQLST